MEPEETEHLDFIDDMIAQPSTFQFAERRRRSDTALSRKGIKIEATWITAMVAAMINSREMAECITSQQHETSIQEGASAYRVALSRGIYVEREVEAVLSELLASVEIYLESAASTAIFTVSEIVYGIVQNIEEEELRKEYEIKQETKLLLKDIVDNIAEPEENKQVGIETCTMVINELIDHVCELKSKAEMFEELFTPSQQLVKHEPIDFENFYYVRQAEPYDISFVEKPLEVHPVPRNILFDENIADIPIGWIDEAMSVNSSDGATSETFVKEKGSSRRKKKGPEEEVPQDARKARASRHFPCFVCF